MNGEMQESLQLTISLPADDQSPAQPPAGWATFDIEATVRAWLTSEVANGDPREDTVSSYKSNLAHWFKWCEANRVNPGAPVRQNIEAFRAELINAKMKPTTVALKLTVVRRFYQSAKDRQLILHNPAAGVKPPTDRRIKNQKKSLTSGHAERLLEALPPADTLKGKRDRAVIGLMMLEGLRRVELHRANDEDIEKDLLGSRLLVHGKIRDRYKYPRRDTMEVLMEYLEHRGPIPTELDQDGRTVTPLICNIIKGGKIGTRISRIGLNYIVDGYLNRAGIKREMVSCHALRHTFGTLLYQETKDLRAVQDELGHANINSTAVYADSGHDRERYSERVPLSLRKEGLIRAVEVVKPVALTPACEEL
jgi:integrase/recombinase XerD